MKVCYLNHDLKENTGAGRFGLALLGCLKEEYSDFHPTVLTAAGVSHLWEKPILYPDIFRLIFVLPRIRSVFKRCDIIHALDGFPYGVIAAIASLGLGKKLVITAVGTGALQALENPVKGAFLRWAYRRADRLVAVSNYTRREILSRASGLDVSVVNHAVDTEEFRALDELTEEEQETIRRMKPYILSVGGGKRRKGFEYSFAAFAALVRRFPGLHYAVVGHDIENTPAASLGVADKTFCFFGIRRPFLRAIYRNAELFMLLPYDDRGDVEGFGFAFLEAAAAGLSVVGTYESGAEDAVDNEKNGFLVDPKNSSAAADAAMRILSNPILKGKFAKGSIDFAKKMSWEKVAKEYAEIYKKLEKSKLQSSNIKSNPKSQ